jgi:hypothetical protein
MDILCIFAVMTMVGAFITEEAITHLIANIPKNQHSKHFFNILLFNNILIVDKIP